MNPKSPIQPRLLLVGAMCLGLTGCFKPGRDARVLRDSLVDAANATYEAEIELGVGAITFALVRGGAALFEAPAEARAALSVVRAAEVGVYHLRFEGSSTPPAELLAAADRAMSRRGWDRLVGVIQDRQTVAIYLPQDLDAGGLVRALVAVVEDREMVIAGLRARPEPLLAAVASGNAKIQIPGLDRPRESRAPDGPGTDR